MPIFPYYGNFPKSEAFDMKQIAEVLRSHEEHWVGDGFPVRSLFSYDGDTAAISPFLLFDYAGPYNFAPAAIPRGVGRHPHRGFETVTIVFEGEVSHKDSTGGGGTIGPGDVQWMTAASGIVHEEFHSTAFTRTGGPFRMVQLWVNLPAKDKMAEPGYQAITNAEIPTVELANGKARCRIIAGELQDVRGPARTFSPVNLWDVRLDANTDLGLELPAEHNAMIAVLSGQITVNGGTTVAAAEIVRFERDGTNVTIRADGATTLLVMTGEPIREPVVGYGPFVMNSDAEIREAIADYNSGRF
jgi:redox-sensitive bicupin YhaK (pirin superfamily)